MLCILLRVLCGRRSTNWQETVDKYNTAFLSNHNAINRLRHMRVTALILALVWPLLNGKFQLAVLQKRQTDTK
jgi:hypothetical protein